MLWCLGDLKMLRNLDILLLVVSNLLIRQVLSSNSDCSVTADQDHVIFTPFVVEYRLSALTGASRLQLIRERGDSQEIVKSVHLNVAQGEEQFACDVITEPGRYKLQVSSDSSTELCWSYVEARWPAIQIRLPRTHESLSGDMAVKLRVPGVACTALETTTRFRLELHYQSRRPVDEIEIVHTANITARRLLQQRSYNLACSLFDLSGFYQVILRAAAPHATVLSGSELVHVTPASYGVTSSLPTLDRCVDTLSLHLKQPHCPAATDKIRVYKKLSTSAMNDPRELQYVTEGSVSAQNLNYVLPCSQFSSQAIGYCFTYVSFSRTGAITEQNKMCINTKKQIDTPVAGGWSNWSDWAGCGVSCGHGLTSRFRTCTEPSPEHGGAYCQGDEIEWKNCFVEECVTMPTPIPARFTLHPSNHNCKCGCELHGLRGSISSDATCSATWLITASPDHVILIHFRSLLMNRAGQLLQVRDGNTTSSPLLLHKQALHTHGDLQLTSKTRYLLVEFKPKFNGEAAGGFYATYLAIETGVTNKDNESLEESKSGSSDKNSWRNKLIIGCVSVLLVGALCLVAILVHRCVMRRQKRLMKLALFSVDPCHKGDDSVTQRRSIHELGATRSSRLQTPKRKSHRVKNIHSPYDLNSAPNDYLHPQNIFRSSSARKSSPHRRFRRRKRPSPRGEEGKPVVQAEVHRAATSELEGRDSSPSARPLLGPKTSTPWKACDSPLVNGTNTTIKSSRTTTEPRARRQLQVDTSPSRKPLMNEDRDNPDGSSPKDHPTEAERPIAAPRHKTSGSSLDKPCFNGDCIDGKFKVILNDCDSDSPSIAAPNDHCIAKPFKLSNHASLKPIEGRIVKRPDIVENIPLRHEEIV